jgi:hypothetical protein
MRDILRRGLVDVDLLQDFNGFFFLESTFKDQINPKRQTAGPPEGGSPELDLASYRLSPLRLSQTLRQPHY